MGKWLEGDLRTDKYAWEIDWDGYYLSQRSIYPYLLYTHRFAIGGYLTYFIFSGLRARGTFYLYPHTCKGKPEQTHETCSRSPGLGTYPLFCMPCSPSLSCQCWHPWSPSRDIAAEKCLKPGTLGLRRWYPEDGMDFLSRTLTPGSTKSCYSSEVQ